MKIGRSIRRVFRGEVTTQTVAREVARRTHTAIRRWRERGMLQRWDAQGARLRRPFSRMEAAMLLEHFQSRTLPRFLPGFSEPPGVLAKAQHLLFQHETTELIAAAELIVADHRWPLLGLGDKCFGSPPDWHRDPLSGLIWPLDYHADLNLLRSDGSDVRTLWELNRLAHLITLARAYTVKSEDRFSAEFFQQVASWHSRNPYGRGANWNCAMEVALRAMNLLGAFDLFRHSRYLDEKTLAVQLAMFDHHGRFIRRNLEFSYVATSNHYLSDIIGLLWLGIMLPELEHAGEWRDFGLREMLREMDKQVTADGADFEASTGYHRFVLELFLYSFILCRANDIEIEERYWEKLHRMLEYTLAYLRPDGYAPLIGDSDSGQVFPISRRWADDHSYVLAIGAVVFNDPRFKLPGVAMPQELLWILGERGAGAYERLPFAETSEGSRAFPDAGVYVMRDEDLYLLFNASGAGVNGRGSHGHNDALSVEVSACGRPFIIDPGTYVYTADLHERHLFRSTAYHSTVEIDGAEQNTTEEQIPFVIGNEAQPRVLEWETESELESVMAEHYGYRRLPQPVTHRRRVVFNRRQRYWFVSDELTGAGEHDLSFRFHLAPGLETSVRSDGSVAMRDKMNGTRLLITARALNTASTCYPKLETRSSSRDYGAKELSVSACWSCRTTLPFALNFVIVPIRAEEDEGERLNLAIDFES
jgi:hypothetical protein